MKFYNREKNSHCFAGVKREKDNIGIPSLKEKFQNLQAQYRGYDIQFLDLAMDVM